MREENLSTQPIRNELGSASFRAAAAALMRAESHSKALLALDALRCSDRAAAVWECVNESLYGAGEVCLLEGDELRRELVSALSRGTPSQIEDLAKWVSRARLPFSYRDQIAAEVIGASAEVRVDWFRDLVGDDPYRRLRAVDLLCAVTPGALSSRESMALASYLFSTCADDHGAVLLRDGPRALASFPFSAERIAYFYSRHCTPAALSVAERAMERNQMISFIATRMLVEYGQQEHREAAFAFIVSRDRLLVGGFDSWSVEAIASIEPNLTQLLTDLSGSGNVLAGAVRALERLPGAAEKSELLISVARARSWSTELIDAIGSFFTAKEITPAALAFAKQSVEPPNDGFSWFKGLFSHFGYTRPQPEIVEVALRVLEKAGEPERYALYRRALSAWDISGAWITAPMRAVVATLLPPEDPVAAAEVLAASNSNLERACKRHHSQLLGFAGRASFAVAQRIIEGALQAGFTRAEVAFEVCEALEAMQKRASDEESLSTLVAFVAGLGRRFPSSTVRVEICSRFYDSLQRIPSGALSAIRERLAECSADMTSSRMVVPEAEYDALVRLVMRDGLRQ